MPSPSSLRDATSPKVRGFGSPPSFRFILYALLPQGEPKALRSDCTPLPKAPPLGELDAVRRPERASPAEAAQGVGLDSANDGADFRKPQSKPTRCVLVRGLTLSVIASRCHLSQSERPWQSAKFAVRHFTPCCRKKSRRRCAENFRLCQGLPLWGSWREAPERASPAEAAQGVGLDSANDGADFAPV